MNRKILSLVLIISMILSALSSFVVFAEDESIILYPNELQFIKKLGIVEDTFEAEKDITRGEFASLVLKMLQIQSGDDGAENAFADVPSSHRYYYDILACRKLGAVSSASTYFRPDDVILCNEAITMIINILGYKQYADAFGGYPYGYVQAGKQYGLLNGIDLSKGSGVNGDFAVKLIYNALFLNVVKLDYVNENEGAYSIYSGSDYLYNTYKIFVVNAIVFSNGLTSLDGQKSDFNDRVILKDIHSGNNLAVFTDDDEIFDCIGMRVKAFVEYDEGINRLFHYEYEEEDILTIDSESVISANNNYIEYETVKDSGEYRKALYSIGETVVLYNGMAINTFNNDIMKPEDGYLELVDNDNNGRFDLINIISFNFRGEIDKYGYISQNNPAWNIVADYIDYEDKYINCKSNPLINNLDLNENEAIYRFTKRSTVKRLEEIIPGNIISVAMAPEKSDNKKVYLLTVSDKEVTDSIVSKTEDSIMCSEGEYQISSSLTKSILSRIEFNTGITFKTDVLGKIAYINKSGGLTRNYGYLVSAEVENSVDGVLEVKIFTKDGKMEIYNVADKCIIDGVIKTSGNQRNAIISRPSEASKFSADKYYSRPVIFTLNKDGLINFIDTDTPNDNVNSKHNDSIYADQSPINYSNEEIEESNALKAGYRTARTTKFKTRTMSFDGRFYINSDTVIISVPDIDTYGLEKAADYLGIGSENAYISNTISYDAIKLCENEKDDENYKILSTSELNTNCNYDAQAYDVDPETGIASLLVLRGRNDIYNIGAFSDTNPLYVFLRKTTYYDSVNKKNVEKIYYTKDGIEEESGILDKDILFKPYSYIVYGTKATGNPYGIETPGLKKGDIIRIEKKGDTISHIDRVLVLDEIDTANCLLQFPQSRKNWYSTGTSNEYTSASLPFDMSKYALSGNLMRSLHIVKPKSISASTLLAYAGTSNINNINIENQTTFNLNYYNLLSSKIVLIENRAGEIKVSEGNITDIVTDKSKLLIKVYDFDVEQIFVFN